MSYLAGERFVDNFVDVGWSSGDNYDIVGCVVVGVAGRTRWRILPLVAPLRCRISPSGDLRKPSSCMVVVCCSPWVVFAMVGVVGVGVDRDGFVELVGWICGFPSACFFLLCLHLLPGVGRRSRGFWVLRFVPIPR